MLPCVGRVWHLADIPIAFQVSAYDPKQTCGCSEKNAAATFPFASSKLGARVAGLAQALNREAVFPFYAINFTNVAIGPRWTLADRGFSARN
jgi:hypothetical protein